MKRLQLANAEEMRMIFTALGAVIAIISVLSGIGIWWLQKQPSPFEKNEKGESKSK